MPKVAIIVRTQNRIIFLYRAIQSILNQTFQDYRVYIVNDGGDSAGTAHIKDSLDQSIAHKFIFIDMPVNSGRGSALSIGLSVVSEDYVLIHDDDDSLEPTFLEKTVSYLEKDKEELFSGVTTSNYDVYEDVQNEQIIVKEKTDKFGMKIGSMIDYSIYLSTIGVIIPISFLFRRKCIKNIGNADTNMNYMEDYDLFLRIMQCGDVGIIPDFLCSYHHREAMEGAYNTSRNEQQYDHHLAYKNKVIREAIAQKSSLKTIQASFVQNKSMNDYHTRHILSQMQSLNESFVNLSNVVSELVRSIVAT